MSVNFQIHHFFSTDDFDDPPPWGWYLWFVKCLDNYWKNCHGIWYTHSSSLHDEFGDPSHLLIIFKRWKWNFSDLGETDFPLVPPSGSSFHLSCEMSLHVLDRLTQNLVWFGDIKGAQTMCPNDFGEHLSWHFHLFLKYITIGWIVKKSGATFMVPRGV